MQRVLVADGGRWFYWNGQDLHTQFGFIRSDEISKAKPGAVLKTNTGKQMRVMDASFIDLFSRLKRMPQIIPRKDVGIIIAETGIGKDSVVIDAGTGSGALACSLAHIVRKVTSYELREDFAEVAQKNRERLGLKNLNIKIGDVYKSVRERNADLVVLDLPEPWLAIPQAAKALKVGGFLVSYSPSIPQVSDFVEALTEDFIFIKTVEVAEREWEVNKRKIRPKSPAIGHSGFMTFTRKIGGEK